MRKGLVPKGHLIVAQYEVLGKWSKRHVRPVRGDRNARLLVFYATWRTQAAIDRPVRDVSLLKKRDPALRTGLLSDIPSGLIFTLRAECCDLTNRHRPRLTRVRPQDWTAFTRAIPLARYHPSFPGIVEKAARFDDRTHISHRLERINFSIQFQRITIEVDCGRVAGLASINQTQSRFVRV